MVRKYLTVNRYTIPKKNMPPYDGHEIVQTIDLLFVAPVDSGHVKRREAVSAQLFPPFCTKVVPSIRRKKTAETHEV
jgi:hypothetical protein